MKKTIWLARTALALALLLALQFATRSLGQLITGSCVNLVIAMAALTCGTWSGLTVALISPFCAYLLGIGPAFLQLVPCVAVGNAVYAAIFGALVRPWLSKTALAAWGTMALGAVCKFLSLWLLIVRLVAPLVVPEGKLAAISAMFTWPQLATALIGGALALVIAPAVRRALKKNG